MKQAKINTSLLTLVQYLLAIGVLLVHSGSLFPNPIVHFIAKSLYGRLAVPVFLVSSAYFLRQQERLEPGATTAHLKKLLPAYLKWSLLYLPYALNYFLRLDLPLYLLPLALLVALLYLGTCYQLWYLPALFLGHFLVKAGRSRWSPRVLFLIAASLYALGSIETYMGYLEGTRLGAAYQAYASIFVTSRNGLFYVPIFLLLGQALADHDKSPLFTQRPGGKLILALLVWFVEASFVYANQGMDKNFFLSLPLVALLLVNWCLKSPWQPSWVKPRLRQLAQFYYFIHPIFIELGLLVLKPLALPKWQTGQLVFAFTLVGSHLTALRLAKKTNKN